MPDRDSSRARAEERRVPAPQEEIIESPALDSASSPQAPIETPTPAQEIPPETVVVEAPAAEAAASAQGSGEPMQTAPSAADAATGEQESTQTAHRPVDEPLAIQSEPLKPATTDAHDVKRELLIKAHSVTQERKRKKIEKIMKLFQKKEQITNDEVEKLLHVSDATATRYLSALESEGKIKQLGKTGKGVIYTKSA